MSHLVWESSDTMSITGLVSYDVGDKLMAGFLFEAGGFRGIGLITVGAHGVEREQCSLL